MMTVQLEVRRVREYGERIYPVGPPEVKAAIELLTRKDHPRWRLTLAELGALEILGVEVVKVRPETPVEAQ